MSLGVKFEDGKGSWTARKVSKVLRVAFAECRYAREVKWKARLNMMRKELRFQGFICEIRYE